MNRLGMAFLVSVLIAGTLGAQDEQRDDKYKDDPAAMCRKGPADPDHPSEHPCNCELICSADDSIGGPQQMENTACQMYCTKERCLCYPDDPCRPDPLL